MNLSELDFLVYSSHKSATQSMLCMLNINQYIARHCHTFTDFNYWHNTPLQPTAFREYLINYQTINNKKLTIITCIRNPINRLLSSFFQSFSTDQIQFLHIKDDETIVSVNSIDELCVLYKKLIVNNTLPGKMESLDELSDILNIPIIDMLEKHDTHYYLNHELFELYVLDFNQVINNVTILDYLNNILGLDLKIMGSDNLSTNKSYYDKYTKVKQQLGSQLDDIIKARYNTFYFNAFVDKHK